MKSNIAIKPILKPIFASALLCGSLLLPAFADDIPAAPIAAPSIAATAGAQRKYIFEPSEVPAPGRKTIVSVILSDTFDEGFYRRILDILDDAGGYTRMDRAKKVAVRLQAACDADPSFIDNFMPPVPIGKEIVLKLISQKDVPDGFIITADQGSMRAVNASSREAYAKRIEEAIKQRLAGINFRDAPFDYQLKDPKDINNRAADYFMEAGDAYSKDKDIEVATSKCELALKLEPGFNNCRLMLADLYVETKQLDKAKLLYQYIADASDADPHDKQAASDQLNKINRGNS